MPDPQIPLTNARTAANVPRRRRSVHFAPMSAPDTQERGPAGASDAGAAAPAALPTGDPAFWDALGFELGCPRCGYNLRMLPAPRCPECGLDFDWGELLSAARGQHEFFFEHNWQARPGPALFLTLWRSLWPASFWRRVPIAAPVRVGPLLVVAAAAVVGGVVAFPLTWLLLLLVVVAGEYGLRSAGWQTPEWMDGLRYAAEWICTPSNHTLIEVLDVLGHHLLWLVGAMGLLASLRQSMGRARVRPLQLLRVTAFAAVPAFLAAGVVSAVMAAALVLFPAIAPAASFDLYLAIFIGMGAVLAVPLALSLRVALRDYLRLPRSTALACMASGAGLLFASAVRRLVAFAWSGDWW